MFRTDFVIHFRSLKCVKQEQKTQKGQKCSISADPQCRAQHVVILLSAISLQEAGTAKLVHLTMLIESHMNMFSNYFFQFVLFFLENLILMIANYSWANTLSLPLT